jgi:DNA-binding NarL/FixJ family response regulator
MNGTRVLLADDHALIARGVRSTLEPQFEIVGYAADGKALVQAAEELRPDIIVLDISMPVLNGLEAAERIRKILPSVKLIFLSQHLDPAYLRQALRVGASGYVLKVQTAEELQQALAAAMRGETFISPAFDPQLVAGLWNRSKELNNESAELTVRQREILQLVVEGRSNKEIADVLEVSIKTVEFHRARLMSKLGARSAAQLAKVAVQRGLIPE